MPQLFATPTHRMFALYGNTGDYFYTPQLRELDVNVWLLTHLKYLGYQRVVFYSPNMKIHFADAASARLAHSTPETDTAPKPLVKTASFRLLAGPLGLGRIRRAPADGDTNAASTVTTSASTMAGSADTPTSNEALRWHFGAMSDSQAISALDRMMREDLATAIVFQNGENLFAMLDTDARSLWDHLLGEWVGTGLAPGSRNMAIVVCRGEMRADFRQLGMLRLARHFFRDDAQNPRPEISLRIGAGRQDEVQHLLHRLRLAGRLNWSPLQIQRESRRLAQGLVPERLDQDVTRMDTLSQEVRQRSEAMAEAISPWEQLRQAPGLGERVAEKLQRLVADARARRQRHFQSGFGSGFGSGAEPAARSPHAVARLNPPAPLPVDRLANLHLALLGSPGTGKTTLARIVAAIYREEGLLESGHLVEVSAAQLIDEHVGGTARRTAEAIARAQEGILFIDNAHRLNSNDFGREAVAELVQAMTTHNGRFAVIIAGYTKEIQAFIDGPQANPGLNRRFPEGYRWLLSNYTAPELYRIFCALAAADGCTLDEPLQAELPAAFENWVRSQDADRFGNAGAVQNLVRGLTQQAGSRRVLQKADFSDRPDWRQWLGLQPLPNLDSLLEPMQKLVGLTAVRAELQKLYHTFQAEMRLHGSLAGMAPGHYLFVGSPGTGKTEVARLMGDMLHRLGLLNTCNIVEISAASFVSRMAGGAEETMYGALREAQGGVLFIDEAHQLAGHQGQDALRVLIPEMENRRMQLCVILAGYSEAMQALLQTDVGLASRTRTIVFEDFSVRELHQIAGIMLKERGRRLSSDASNHLLRLLAFHHARRAADFGNARMVRDLIHNDILPAQSRRINEAAIPAKDPRLTLIEPADLPHPPGFVPDHWDDAVTGRATTDVTRLLDELGRLVGLHSVKDAIRSLADRLAVQQVLGNARPTPGHYVFSGNPGTGKTTVARLMGRILRALGLLERGHVVEVKREDLVGRYVGHAENNTKEKITEALNGILFIDEAYQLVDSESDSFGRRALETLLTSMEDERARLCIIMAGYPAQMRRLVDTNPGLKSRINAWIDFEDYTAAELYQIALNMLAEQGYNPDDAAAAALAEHLHRWDARRGQPDFGNARDVRNLVDAIIARQNRRIVPYLREWADERLRVIEVGDIMAPAPPPAGAQPTVQS